MAGIPEWVVETSLDRDGSVVTDNGKVGGANVTSSGGEGKDGENLRGGENQASSKGWSCDCFHTAVMFMDLPELTCFSDIIQPRFKWRFCFSVSSVSIRGSTLTS